MVEFYDLSQNSPTHIRQPGMSWNHWCQKYQEKAHGEHCYIRICLSSIQTLVGLGTVAHKLVFLANWPPSSLKIPVWDSLISSYIRKIEIYGFIRYIPRIRSWFYRGILWNDTHHISGHLICWEIKNNFKFLAVCSKYSNQAYVASYNCI